MSNKYHIDLKNQRTWCFQRTLCIKSKWENKSNYSTVHPFQNRVSSTSGKLSYLNFPAKVLTGKVVSTEQQSTHRANLVSPIVWRLTVSTVLRVNLAITKSSLPDHTIILPRRHCGQSGVAGAANSGLTIYSPSHIQSLRSNPIQHVLIFISRGRHQHSQMHQTVKRCELARSIHRFFPERFHAGAGGKNLFASPM